MVVVVVVVGEVGIREVEEDGKWCCGKGGFWMIGIHGVFGVGWLIT